MSLVDHHAASLLRELREERGLSPEGLAVAIREAAAGAPWGIRGTVDAHTIRRVERYGHVPRERVRFVLARYFDLAPHDLWQPGNQWVVA